ncbi:MAG: filamentous hemagglutinin N-terminal domain-containing protein, partial [Verrucomicrobiota bacterium]
MKPKPNYFRSTPIFATSLRCGVPAFVGFTVLISGLTANAGDILRGGRSGSNANGIPNAAGGGGAATPAATAAARANALDALARTSRALDAMAAMQNAARNAGITGANSLGKNPANQALTLPSVPNGIATGGLQVAPVVATDPTKWSGAQLPAQTNTADGSTKVTVKQTTQQALLNWQTFNVGKETTLSFDQSAGGENVSQWIAFNKISDPSGNPTQILGSIKADGQVYVINGNGIIFGGSSRVDVRSLTVSSLPVNDNLVKQGLLNNRDAQFLFSGLNVPGGSDGTPNFDSGTAPASGRYGDVTVQAGAVLESPAGSGGNGGRIMLVGPNVTNAGTISTESGQTILAAGLQVAVAAHNGSDPSLRGLDVWVGAAGDYAGAATNSGLIEVLTGSAWLSGRQVSQLGVINSSTSVNLNGRIDLKASYGAVGNPNFDSTTGAGAGGPMFFNQFTGVVTLGSGSVAQILPDYASGTAVPGTALPTRSQANIEGLSIHFDKDSVLFAPNANVSVRAGVWPYKDADGNRTIFSASGAVETGLSNYYSGANQRFYFNGGQIYLDEAAMINVAGSVDVLVPLAQSILSVQLRGPELADSPLQRDSNLRGASLTVDIRNTGTYDGRYWIGTPLGDVTGLAGLIERNAAQLTAVGGNITLQAGGSVVVGKGATLDVSGGFFQHQGGLVKTSALIYDGRLVAIKDATPDRVYDGVFTGDASYSNEKWNVSANFDSPLFTGTVEAGYVEGAAGGRLSITAPGMVLAGDLRGLTVQGPRQRATPPASSALLLNFEAEKTLQIPGSSIIYFIKNSPTPPAITFSNAADGLAVPAFALAGDAPVALPAARLSAVTLAPDLLAAHGFGTLGIANPDGSITVPADVRLEAMPKGAITFAAANISILGEVDAVAGALSFTTYNISPSAVTEYNLVNPSGSVAYPTPSANRGHFTLASGASLSTAAMLVDDGGAAADLTETKALDGGTITINSYQALLAGGSALDVSGGAYVSKTGKITYGKGGGIAVLAGKDPAFAGVIGGSLVLDSTLAGYSGTTGGTLSVQAGPIQIGGAPRANALNLSADFFRIGGFTQYNLTGIGAALGGTPPAGQVEFFTPAVSIAAGCTIAPLAESLLAVSDPEHGGAIGLRRTVAAPGLRAPVSLAFAALGSDDPFTLYKLEARGDIIMGAGAAIACEAGASVSFKGGTVTLLGSVSAPGGSIAVTGDGAFPLTRDQRALFTQALPTVHLGAAAQLSVAGITQLVPDNYGRRLGKGYDGGKISISGNIVAESGSVLDVSGTSGVLDLSPLGLPGTGTVGNAGFINSTPLPFQGIATRIDSKGGLIDLSGSQMLLSDATLRGAAGGASAVGGELSVFSGSYYAEGQARTSADVNLVVKQSGNVILNPGAHIGVGIGLVDNYGVAYGNSGCFAIERFIQGAFASLDLGGKYMPNASPIPYGGNVGFQGKIDIQASGTLRLAAGGVIQANDSVRISASYISLGQDFRAPQHPDDILVAFQMDPAYPSNEYNFAPTYGPGTLDLRAGLIDVGLLSLQNIGRANLTASGGDIRGNGTLSMAGDLVLQANQIYPTTLGKFDVFAYDHSGVAGSITVRADGTSAAPLSAGGSLALYASNILQAGVLRAPSGTIRLGWDGMDLDKSTTALDAPKNLIAGATIATPVARDVTLTSASITSVSVAGMVIPFGVSPDGLTWIDPRGVNVTMSGLPEKSIVVGANSITMAAGATLDIRGGGDLLASRWVAGNGGSQDLLGTASAAWGAGAPYQSGTLVTYQGATWSARVSNSGQAPGANLYWSKVDESFAIIPGFSARYAPYGAYNTGSNASALAGNPGNVNGSLKVGDSITLEASAGVAAGTYTLLPREYA